MAKGKQTERHCFRALTRERVSPWTLVRLAVLGLLALELARPQMVRGLAGLTFSPLQEVLPLYLTALVAVACSILLGQAIAAAA